LIYTPIYKGILITPNLWHDSTIHNIEQFIIADYSFKMEFISPKLRLGMFVEQCIFQSLNNDPGIQILAKNIQIIENNLTLGEIDCLLKQGNEIIHLEIAYKFYLFDPNVSPEEINCWIGPNRKDSLIEKINKINHKQFPLLFHTQTNKELHKMNIEMHTIQQKVCFKAQLFVPYSSTKKSYISINEECIEGFYYSRSELDVLKENTFFIPTKLEWTAIPSQHNKWISFESLIDQISPSLFAQKSPMIWYKNKKGIISKCFVVWW